MEARGTEGVYHLDMDDHRVQAAREAERRAYDHYGLSFTEHFVDVPAFDIRMRVLEVGDGPPLILVIGGVGKGVGWLPLLPEVDGYTCYIVDRPGGGLSDGLDYRSIPLHEQATPATVALLEHFDIDTAPVIGNSNGGAWSLSFALEEPDRVSGIGLFGCPGFYPGWRVPMPMRIMGVPWVGEFLIERMMQPDSGEDVKQTFEALGHPSQTIERLPEAFFDAWHRMDALPHFTWSYATMFQWGTRIWRPRGSDPALEFTPDELRDIDVPALLCWGTNDPFGGVEIGRAGSVHFPEATFHEVATGHLPWLDDPESCGELLREFLD